MSVIPGSSTRHTDSRLYESKKHCLDKTFHSNAFDLLVQRCGIEINVQTDPIFSPYISSCKEPKEGITVIIKDFFNTEKLNASIRNQLLAPRMRTRLKVSWKRPLCSMQQDDTTNSIDYSSTDVQQDISLRAALWYRVNESAFPEGGDEEVFATSWIFGHAGACRRNMPEIY